MYKATSYRRTVYRIIFSTGDDSVAIGYKIKINSIQELFLLRFKRILLDLLSALFIITLQQFRESVKALRMRET